jgi:hypothetical protein
MGEWMPNSIILNLGPYHILILYQNSNPAVATAPSYGSSSFPKHFANHIHITYFQCFGPQHSLSKFLYLFLGYPVYIAVTIWTIFWNEKGDVCLLKNMHKVPAHSNFSDKQWHTQKLDTVEDRWER